MSDNIIFKNNASALLSTSITDVETSVAVAVGFGVLFPSPGAGEYFLATLEDDSGNVEFVKCTARVDDLLTVVRAQDGSTAQAFTLAVTRVELRLIKEVCEEFLQKNGGTMTGDVDFNENTITDVHLEGANTKILNGEIVNVPLRGVTGVTGNEVVVPTGGGRATAGGAGVVVNTDDIVALLDSAGVITLDSATVGVKVVGGAYLRIQGPTAANRLEMSHDDTDFTFNFSNTDDVFWDTALTLNAVLTMGADIEMADNDIRTARYSDWAVKSSTKNTSGTTTFDYETASYWVVTHDTNVSSLVIENLPANGVAFLRFRLVHSSGGETMNWDSLGTNVRYPAGTEPDLSSGAGDIDIVDLWTEDGGTNWYVVGSVAWATA